MSSSDSRVVLSAPHLRGYVICPLNTRHVSLLLTDYLWGRLNYRNIRREALLAFSIIFGHNDACSSYHNFCCDSACSRPTYVSLNDTIAYVTGGAVSQEIRLPPARLFALDEYAADVQPIDALLETDICYDRVDQQFCQIIVQRQLVSRLHARIERIGPRYLLHDTGSANGTFINGRRITEPHLLTDRDLIGLGAPVGILRFADVDPTFVPTESAAL